jgi:hypothetical protein
MWILVVIITSISVSNHASYNSTSTDVHHIEELRSEGTCNYLANKIKNETPKKDQFGNASVRSTITTYCVRNI